MKIYNEKQECVGFLMAKDTKSFDTKNKRIATIHLFLSRDKKGILYMLDDFQIRESLNLKAKEKFTIQAENPQEIELFGKEQI
ncbi:hypothetical protein, partial [Helicobacter typhlonius]